MEGMIAPMSILDIVIVMLKTLTSLMIMHKNTIMYTIMIPLKIIVMKMRKLVTIMNLSTIIIKYKKKISTLEPL